MLAVLWYVTYVNTQHRLILNLSIVAKQEIPTCKNEFVLGEFFVHLIMIAKNELISFRKALIVYVVYVLQFHV